MNTGEGGLSTHHLDGSCDIVFQIGTAKYGVRDAKGRMDDGKLTEAAARDEVKMFELKLSQGAKPGKGGILPGEKVTEEIARFRGIPAGQDSISSNRHPQINSVEQLLELLDRIRKVTGKRVGFKAVLGAHGWLDKLFREINARGAECAPDFITVDSADGGTGAAPMPLTDDMGLPLRESLPMLIDKINEHGLREHIKVVASGKLITPAEVAWALCVSADFVASARGNMFALGCIQACNATRTPAPRGLPHTTPTCRRVWSPDDKAGRVAHYIRNMVKEVGIIAHSCGVKEPRQLKRFHARVVQNDGRPLALSEPYPDAEARRDAA